MVLAPDPLVHITVAKVDEPEERGMKADRLTKLVKQMYLPTSHITIRRDIVDLLRREQAYQWAKVRRIIKAERARVSQIEPLSKNSQIWITAKKDALDWFLAAMNRRTK